LLLFVLALLVGLPLACRPKESQELKESVVNPAFSVTKRTHTTMEENRSSDFLDWQEMPTETLLKILGFLTPRELAYSTTVSKAWQQLVEGN